MKKLLKHFSRKTLKEDLRKLGINLITASIIGEFVTHAAQLSIKANLSIISVGITGLAIFLFGLYKLGAK